MRFFICFLVIIIVGSLQLSGQSTSTFMDSVSSENRIYTRLYGELVYNQKLRDDVRHNGVLDARRIVLMLGYQFDQKLQFVSEIEFEHANEIFVEQAFLKYQFNNLFNLKAGMLLIPSGIVNEDHEPISFYTVDRPYLDKVIVPSTWREIGIGFSGLSTEYSIKYQTYLVNGLLSYNGQGLLNGKNGLRGGRQKAIKSVVSTLPSLATKFEYFGIQNLKVAISAYLGKTQSAAFNELDKMDQAAFTSADSTVVGITHFSFNTIYQKDRFNFRSQFSLAKISNTKDYNEFTNSDLAEMIMGYYITFGYTIVDKEQKLSGFVQWSQVDTHASTINNLERNITLNKSFLTLGLNWNPNRAAVYKLDYQFISNEAGENYDQLNAGIGVWF